MNEKNKFLIIALISTLLLAGSASAAVDFPADEAGISAYVKASSSINLNDTKSAFASIERETSEYIIGTVELSLHSEEQYPHVYVSNDGWIVSYYPNDRPSSWLFPWYSYGGGPISTTTLVDAINIVVNQVGGSSNGIKYYDFRFPNATKMMMIAESASSNTNYFKMTVPNIFELYEAGWSHYSSIGAYSSSIAKLDGIQFSGHSFGAGGGIKTSKSYGNFNTSTNFLKGVEHQIDISSTSGTGRIGLVLEYAE